MRGIKEVIFELIRNCLSTYSSDIEMGKEQKQK